MKTILMTLALAASATLLHAQPEGGARPGGPDGAGMKRPVPPLMAALDTDKDGEISAAEIDAAVTALKTLDKNGDGKVDKTELRPEMPQRGEGGKGGKEGGGKGPRGEGRPGGRPPQE